MYRWLVKNISYPLIARRNGLTSIKKNLKKIEDIQYWSNNKLFDYQLKQIKKLLIYAFENNNFYKKRFNDAGFNAYKFKDFDDLKKIPLLDKTQIRENLRTLISVDYKENDLAKSETGGTTGVKMKFYINKTCLSQKEAALYRFEKWAGWDIGLRKGIVWPALQDYVGHWTLKSKVKNELFERQIVFPAVNLNEERVLKYLKVLDKKKPSIIRGFASPLYEISLIIIKNNIKTIHPRGVITTGEPLYEHQRNIISKAFNCEVYDSYRTREVGPIAQECHEHDGLHINAESLFIELVKSNCQMKYKDDLKEIVVTDLLNYGMPLIRYRIGDFGILSDKKCLCGRGLPLLKGVAGRTPDIFYSTEGDPIAAITLVLYLVDEAPGMLGQVQIVQDRLDHIIIRMTPDPMPTDAIKEYQLRKAKEILGKNMNVSFKIVNTIQRETSGKYLFTKCLIDKKGNLKEKNSL